MELWQLQETAKRTGTSVSLWRKIARRREIPVIKIGRSVRLNAADVVAYLAARTSPAKELEK
jgi:excisionase family DNA binding protein